MSTQPFVIDQVSWHTNTPGNTESREQVLRRFWLLTEFLQSRNLAARPLANEPADITDSFALKSDDLTAEGLELLKKVYDKWLSKVDEGLDPTDMTMFEKHLTRVRSR